MNIIFHSFMICTLACNSLDQTEQMFIPNRTEREPFSGI